MLLKERLPFIKASCRATDLAYDIILSFLDQTYEKVKDVYDCQLYFLCDEPFVAIGSSVDLETVRKPGKVLHYHHKEISFFLFIKEQGKFLDEGGLFSSERIFVEIQQQLNEVIAQSHDEQDLLPPLKEFVVSLEISEAMG